jgi:hypothetical protein
MLSPANRGPPAAYELLSMHILLEEGYELFFVPLFDKL